MKKLFVILSITSMILAENIEDEIMNKIDVKKEIEERLELSPPFYSHSSFIPPYIAERNMFIYHTCAFLDMALTPYFYKYIKKFKIENESELSMYEHLFFCLIHSTHILIGEVIEVEDGTIYNNDCLTYCTKALIKVVEEYKGKFEKNIIPVWLHSCEKKISSTGMYERVFPKDTCFFFLVNLPANCEEYIKKYGGDTNYFPKEFFLAAMCGSLVIMKINGYKRVLGCVGQEFNLPYENVIDILNTFVPICEKLQEKVRKYKFPLKDEEFAEFMKKRGYHYPLTDEEIEKIAKKTEKRRMEVENERKRIFGF
jgi:hypothetical protein